MQLKKIVVGISIAMLSGAVLTGCGGSSSDSSGSSGVYKPPSISELVKGIPEADTSSAGYAKNIANMKKVLETNADIAFKVYSDSVITAKKLQTAVNNFKASPTQENLDAAKKAWLVSREPYGESEVYRFRESPIDSVFGTDDNEDGPEGSINAWPLGEALIDYVISGEPDFGADQLGVTEHGIPSPVPAPITGAEGEQKNIINTASIPINADLLGSSASADDERDVISGYHAIEFLLWGQDLNGGGGVTDGTDRSDAVKSHGATNIAIGGQRPVTDFQAEAGVEGERRLAYLKEATDLLVEELTSVRDAWDQNGPSTNYVNGYFLKTGLTDAEVAKRMEEILMGMGTMSEGELAGERMQIALATNSQEDEHSCFSDNTHRDIYLNAKGVYNSFFGTYAGYDSDLDGSVDVTTNAVDGYGIDDYLKDTGKGDVADRVGFVLKKTQEQAKKIDALARAGKPFDVLIQSKKSEVSEPVRNTILLLNKQSDEIQQIADVMGLGNVVDPDASACDTTNPTAACPE